MNLRAGEPPAHSPKPHASTKSLRGRATAAPSGIQSAGSQSILANATYLGNPGYRINALALGSDGTIYVAGVTVASGAAIDPTQLSSGAGTAFVARLSSDGSQLLYFTNLGTGAADEARALAVDLSGNAYVTGQTHSNTFPVANAIQSACTQNSSGQCSGDAFLAKVNPQGAIVYATYLGGSGEDAGNAISLDASGNIYIAGATTSTDFPTFKPAQSSLGGGEDAFVAKISADGSRVLFATYLGGKGDDEARGIALDAAGNIFVAGATASLDFPTQSAFESACVLTAKSACAGEAFVTKLSSDGSTLLYSTYLGGSGGDAANAIAVDATGSAYITGVTNSSNFPLVKALQPRAGGGGDAFVSRLSPDGKSLIFSTYLGGSAADQANAIALDSFGNVFVSGWTGSPNFPTLNPLQSACKTNSQGACSVDSFVVALDAAGSAIHFATYLGGSGVDDSRGIAVDAQGSIHLAGATTSTDFPAAKLVQLPKSGAGSQPSAGSSSAAEIAGGAVVAEITGVNLTANGFSSGGSSNLKSASSAPPDPPTACTGTTTNWIGGTGNWSNAAMWNTGVVPNSAATNVCIDDGNAANSVVTLDIGASVGTLTIDSGDILIIGNNQRLAVNGNISNAGQIQVTATVNTTVLAIGTGVTLSGGGTVTLSSSNGGAPLINEIGNGGGLTNADNTIQGIGQIGNNGLALVNQANGIINGNGAGTLVLNTAGITNQGLLESTSGALQISTTTNNSGGTISATGTGIVQFVNGANIQGGAVSATGGGVLGTAASNTVTLDGSTHGVLTIAGTYTAANNSTTVIAGTISNTGSFQLAATVNTTLLSAGTGTMLSGGGSLTLSSSNGGAPIINEAGNGGTLINVNNMIQGAGQIGNNGLAFTNQAAGVVNANVAGAALLLNSSGVTNQGLLEATNGGILQTSTTINNLNATITANGKNSTVQFLNGTIIQAGTLSVLNTGTLGVAASNTITLDGTTHGALTNANTYTGANNSTTVLVGTINNTGTIQVAATVNTTLLAISGNVSLMGGGMVTLSSSGGGTPIINEATSGAALTNVDNTIQGGGQIGNNGLALINKATIDANLTGGILSVNPGSLTNQGTLEATAGGTMQPSAAINNVGGTITVDGSASAMQFLNGTTIQGGTLKTTNSGVLGTAASQTITLNGSAPNPITNAGTFTAANNSTTVLLGTIINPGLIQVAATVNTTILSISGNVSLTGSGTVTLASSNGGTPVINEAGNGSVLTNVSNTIQGVGQIGNNGLALVNQGTINANLGGGTLTINPSGTTNPGLLEATAGTLALVNSVLNNAGGNIEVSGATSAVQFASGATVQGGTLTSANGGVMGTAASATITLDGKAQGQLTIVGTYTAANNSTTVVVGTIVNTGTIQIAATVNTTLLAVNGAVNLTGGGTVTLASSSGGLPLINEAANGSALTNVSNTIQGVGQIGNNGLALVNQGTINASVAGGTLTINPASTNNQGLLEATAGTLQLAISVVNNAAGTIKVVGAASSVQFVASATIQGGTLATASGGVLGVAASNTITLDGSSQGVLTISGAYTGANNSTTILVGTINNTGAILVNATVNTTLLAISGGVSLAGGGVVTLSSSNGGTPVINESASGSTLTNMNNMIQGVGQIGNNGLVFVNQATGIVNANVAGGTLLLNSNGVTNQGLLEATNGGTLQTSTTINNLNATITANGKNSTVQFLSGTTIQAGTLSVLNTGILGVAASNTITLDGTTHGALTNANIYTGANNSSTNLLGTINNTGTIQVAATVNTTLLAISGNVSLTGAGMVTLSSSNGGTPVISEAANGSVLTNVGNTIQGVGQIGNNGLAVVNQATINSNAGGTLTINPATITNQGVLESAAGSTLQVSLAAITNTGGTLKVDGALSVPAVFALNGGTLSGAGTISGNVSLGPSAITQPGDAPLPGILTINGNGTGNYTQGATDALNIVIGGATPGTQYSQLNLTGAANLNGTFNVTLANGFTPAAGAQFTILNAASVTGQFSTPNLPNLPAGLLWTVTYNPTSVVLVAAAPASIAVTPANPSIAVNATLQFTATATFAGGSTQDVTNAVTWGSSLPATATINATGLATGVAAGPATTISATLGNVFGSTMLTVTSSGNPALTQVTPNTGGQGQQNLSIAITGQATHFAQASTVASFGAGITVASLTINSATSATAVINIAQAAALGTRTVTLTTGNELASLTNGFTVTALTLTSIAVTPNPPASIAVGATEQFTATGTFSDGSTQNLTASATWNSSLPGFATISNVAGTRGLATGVAAGMTAITASVGAITSPPVSLTVTATGPTLTSITVAPLTASVAVGSTQPFAATGHFSDGSTGTVTVTWMSSNNAIATVNTAGVASGVTPGGPVTITATSTQNAAISGNAQLTVTAAPPTLTSITVAPLTASVAVGATQPFAATGHFSDGSTGAVSVTWTSSNNAIATVNAAGVATGVTAGGPINIIATSTQNAAISGAAQLTVTASAPTLTSITVAPLTASVAVGATQPFLATGHFSDGSTGAVSVTWMSSNNAIATINAAGVAMGVTAGGPINIIATSTQNAAISGSAQLTVTASAPTLTSITVAPTNASVAIGSTQPFAATGHFSDGSTGAVTVTWMSSNNAIATINAAGVATGVTAGGPITITATSTQNAAISGMAQLTVTAASPTLRLISVAPLAPSIAVGGTQPFTATGHFSDGSTGAVTVNWMSSNNAIATVNAAGVASGLTPGGPITITATSTQNAAISGTAELNVIGSALVSIAVTPANPSAPAGTTLQFHATGTYADTSTKDITTTVVWESSNTEAATIDVTGFATLVAMGQSTVSATLGNISGNTVLSVSNAPFTLTLSPPAPGQPAVPVVAPGGTVAFGLVLTAIPGFSGTVQFACTTTNPTLTCAPDPNSIALNPNSPSQVAIVLNTFCQGTAASARQIPAGGSGQMAGGLALLLMSLVFGGAALSLSSRRRQTWALSFAVLLLIALGSAACSSLPKGPNGATQPGPVTVTVTASANGATATAPPLKLIIE